MSFTSFEAAQRRANIDEARRNPKASDMSLRDYFASKAMQEFVGVCDYKEGAIRAYKWADAMLEARK